MTDRTDDRTDDDVDPAPPPGDGAVGETAVEETVYVPADDTGPTVYVPTDEPNGDEPAVDEAAAPGQDFGAWFDREFPPEPAAEPATDELVVEPEAETDKGTPPAGPVVWPASERPTPWGTRVVRRIVRRPKAWIEAPWPAERIVRVAFTLVVLVVSTVAMMNAVHLNPLNGDADLILDDNTPTGGDMGAHVWGPAYLRDVLLPNFQLNGWSMDWYAGMPAYRFYMVLPALGMVALDMILPYGVAFKLIAVAGLVTLPFACWAFGRLARFRYPMPELFALAGVVFALDESTSIYGGNLKATMAGEFSFSIALTLGILGLGFLANGLRTGKYRSWAAILLAAGAVSHGIVAIFIAVAALVIFLAWFLGDVIASLSTADRAARTNLVRRFGYGLTAGVATILLTMWWIGPFVSDHAYMTDMKYGARPEGAADSFWDMFFPLEAPLDVLITVLAVGGFAACIGRRHTTGTALGVTGLVLVGLVYLTQDSLPVIGLLWNPRLLPFIYLLRYVLMMVGIVEIGALIANLVRDRPARALPGVGVSTATAATAALAVLIVLGFMFEVLPGGGRRTSHDANVYAWGPIRKTSTAGDAVGDGWSRYNFQGYENRPLYAEYYDVVTTMERIGATRGCGRATWENHEDNGKYGTTMALMLLPHWTDGCIGSMEGLFFEASGTTPYHFLTTAAMSASSSNPVRELRYVNTDADVGVPHLQKLGVRYVMVRSPEAKTEAASHAELTLLASSGPWDIYEVANSGLVVPLTVQPVVVNGRPGDQRERNLELGTSWFQQPDEWAAQPADDGPDAWQRIDVAVDESRSVPDPNRPADDPDTRGRQVDIVVPVQTIEPVPLPAAQVSNVVQAEQELSFEVDQVGVPMLVKLSYFPNWEVDGADGPYRVAPNLMVVIPTENEVRLHYGRSGTDTAFYLLTLAGIGMLVWMRRRGDVRYVEPTAAAAPSPEPPGDVDDQVLVGEERHMAVEEPSSTGNEESRSPLAPPG